MRCCRAAAEGTLVAPRPTQTGAATLKIKSAAGKELGSRRTELQSILDHFNIDVDNPINIMTQDGSRKFLHSGTNKARGAAWRRAARVKTLGCRAACARALVPARASALTRIRCGGALSRTFQDRYLFFVKAMLLQDIQDHLALTKDLLAQTDSELSVKKAELPQLEQQLKALEEELALFSELDTQKARLEGLKKRWAWALVADAEADLAKAEAMVKDFKDVKLVKVERVLKARTETLAQLEEEQRERRRALAEFMSASTATAEERKAALTAASKARKAADDAKREAMGTQRQQEDVRCKTKQITNAMETARETQVRETQAETRAADAATEKARVAVARAQEAVQKARAEEGAAVQAAEAARARRDADGEDAEAFSREEAAARQEVTQLQNAQRNGMMAFGEKMPALLKGE